MEFTLRARLTHANLGARPRLRMSRNPGGIGLILILAFGAIDAGVMAVIVAMATLAGGSR